MNSKPATKLIGVFSGRFIAAAAHTNVSGQEEDK